MASSYAVAVRCVRRRGPLERLSTAYPSSLLAGEIDGSAVLRVAGAAAKSAPLFAVSP